MFIMYLDQMLAQVEALQVSVLMRESTWLFPTVETVHVLALTLVIGTIARVDLRLLSILNAKDSVQQVMAGLLPWTWGAFLVAAVSGTLMFCSHAVKYAENVPMLIKFVLLGFAGVNMMLFHIFGLRHVAEWDTGPTPGVAKVAAATSLAVWLSIVGFGRWIGFV
jgi:hypothetical protein